LEEPELLEGRKIVTGDEPWVLLLDPQTNVRVKR
jgi:hypothetical protein